MSPEQRETVERWRICTEQPGVFMIPATEALAILDSLKSKQYSVAEVESAYVKCYDDPKGSREYIRNFDIVCTVMGILGALEPVGEKRK